MLLAFRPLASRFRTTKLQAGSRCLKTLVLFRLQTAPLSQRTCDATKSLNRNWTATSTISFIHTSAMAPPQTMEHWSSNPCLSLGIFSSPDFGKTCNAKNHPRPRPLGCYRISRTDSWPVLTMTSTPKIEGLFFLKERDLKISDTAWPQQVEAASKTPVAPTIDLPQFLEMLQSGAPLGSQIQNLPGRSSFQLRFPPQPSFPNQ